MLHVINIPFHRISTSRSIGIPVLRRHAHDRRYSLCRTNPHNNTKHVPDPAHHFFLESRDLLQKYLLELQSTMKKTCYDEGSTFFRLQRQILTPVIDGAPLTEELPLPLQYHSLRVALCFGTYMHTQAMTLLLGWPVSTFLIARVWVSY